MANPIAQFEIKDIIPLYIGGIDVSFTNASLWMLISAFISMALLTLTTRRASIIPSRLQVVGESVYVLVANMIRQNTGSEGMRYFPFIFSIFIIVLMGNLMGMLPYSFTYTSHLAVTASLAVFIFIFVTAVGFIRHGKAFFGFFAPAGVPFALKFFIVPLELISYLSRPLTLSMRLFANMMAGHLILKVFAGFCVSLMSVSIFASSVPMIFNVLMIAFEFMVAFLQAYVFTVLTCIYFKDAIDMH